MRQDVYTISTTRQRDDEGTKARIVLHGATANSLAFALSDELSLRMLVSAVAGGKTVQDISDEQGVPLSSCYRRASELVDQGLLLVERIVVTADGNRYRVYRSTFKTLEIALDFRGLSASAELNEAVELRDVPA
jgi:hypothetical protein